ncbi:hypothetical protein V5O48_013239 [Marasmius crinis-equi]|uniref:Ricin B lectin domain-containing protein n=1 Tax=Marasmius crinis-equi TaxID=585013 RepID=A0ABR3F0M3_9AGAR
MASFSSLFALCAVASALLGGALANPVARATCSPNFEGAGISVLGANGFVTPDGRGHGSPAPFWHIQQTGQPVAGYIFRDIANDNQVLTRNPDNSLTMGAASNNGNDVRQIFNIECQTCASGAAAAPPRTPIATDCQVKMASDTSLCLQVGRPPSDDLNLIACGTTPGSELYQFST